MSTYEVSCRLFRGYSQRSTEWNENGVQVTVRPPVYTYTEWNSGMWTTHTVDNSQLRKAVAKLSQDLCSGGEYVNATREVVQSLTSAVNELKAMSSENEVKKIWQVRFACERTAEAVATACKYIDKIDDIPRYGCSEEMRDLAEKKTTYSSIRSDLKMFKSIIEKMQNSLSAVEELSLALNVDSEQSVRACNVAEGACNDKAEEQRRKKKAAQIAGGTLAAAGIGAAVVGGGVATVAIGVLTAGIGTPIAAGVTAAVAGGIGATAGTAGVTTAIATAVIAEAFDKAAKAFSNAGRQFASVSSSALRLSRAAADVRRDLVRISEELDAALDLPLYTSVSTMTAIMNVLQTETKLLVDNSGTARQITAECRETLIMQKTEVAQYSCRSS